MKRTLLLILLILGSTSVYAIEVDMPFVKHPEFRDSLENLVISLENSFRKDSNLALWVVFREGKFGVINIDISQDNGQEANDGETYLYKSGEYSIVLKNYGDKSVIDDIIDKNRLKKYDKTLFPNLKSINIYHGWSLIEGHLFLRKSYKMDDMYFSLLGYNQLSIYEKHEDEGFLIVKKDNVFEYTDSEDRTILGLWFVKGGKIFLFYRYDINPIYGTIQKYVNNGRDDDYVLRKIPPAELTIGVGCLIDMHPDSSIMVNFFTQPLDLPEVYLRGEVR